MTGHTLLPHRGSRLAAGLLLALVLAVLGLLAAFLLNIRLTDRQFDLANIAERQATAVARIAAEVEAGTAPRTLDASLDDYRRLIDRETALLASDPAAMPHQREEMAGCDRLRALAFDPVRRPELRALVAQIGGRESAEVVAARIGLAQLHDRTTVLASLLAAAAILCAVGGGWILLRRNRDLAELVRQRTSRIEEVDRSRRLFFAKASHELRTPVTAMRGEAEVALADASADRERLRASLGHVLANATFLGHRIEELLGLAGAEDGKLHLARDPLDLGDVVAVAARDAAAFAGSVEVALQVETPDRPLPVTGDARWLRQALLAVIDNALKFSPIGGILRLDLQAEAARARVTIADEGPGVVAEDLPRIFDAYYQADAGRMRGGSGLGLALARWVAEQHGGSICAENLPQRGCRFVLSLPLEQPA